MAKHPAPGRVKTRLAAVIGAAAACALSEAFVGDLAERLATLGWAVTWYVWPPAAPFARLVPGARCRSQRGDDLGARMADAIAREHAESAGPVVVLGADVPHVALAAVAEAVAALAAGTDVVLGPADDGGYYLLGVHAPLPALLADVPWGTDRVLATTCAHAARLGLRVHRLPATFDVDAAEDVAALHALIRTGAVALPRTAAVLARLYP